MRPLTTILPTPVPHDVSTTISTTHCYRYDKELSARGYAPGNWKWIVPPLAASANSTTYLQLNKMTEYTLKPGNKTLSVCGATRVGRCPMTCRTESRSRSPVHLIIEMISMYTILLE